ncbi:Spy/CpxP family protein refolding chaperone [candidate division KSB1 bacterium]|nr:Spy/CpxP family protein refolding chaperone [candidate division KSB1 bacterium]
MSHKILIIGLLLLSIVVGVFFMSGCRRHACTFHQASPEKRAEWMVKRISSELDLNESQKKEVNRIKDEILAKKKGYHNDHHQIYETVLAQVKGEKVDEVLLNQLFQDKEAQFKEMRSFMISKFAEFHKILTPVQREKLAKRMNEFHEHFQN